MSFIEIPVLWPDTEKAILSEDLGIDLGENEEEGFLYIRKEDIVSFNKLDEKTSTVRDVSGVYKCRLSIEDLKKLLLEPETSSKTCNCKRL